MGIEPQMSMMKLQTISHISVYLQYLNISFFLSSIDDNEIKLDIVQYKPLYKNFLPMV